MATHFSILALEKSTDSGARQATVHEVTKSQTWQWAQDPQAHCRCAKKEDCKTQKWAHKGFIVTHAHPSLFPDGYFRLCFGLNSSPSFCSTLSAEEPLWKKQKPHRGKSTSFQHPIHLPTCAGPTFPIFSPTMIIVIFVSLKIACWFAVVNLLTFISFPPIRKSYYFFFCLVMHTFVFISIPQVLYCILIEK